MTGSLRSYIGGDRIQIDFYEADQRRGYVGSTQNGSDSNPGDFEIGTTDTNPMGSMYITN